jgi:2-polyprenyl-3-methyl-5-hydroxy-6-metoxy-1,4-benzoquinol methylase
MIDDFTVETVRFSDTGKYSSTSFAEVNDRVYACPEVMEYYMHGLLLTQFIWVHHFELLKYYAAELSRVTSDGKKYLEVGGGHGLYVNLAQEILNKDWSFTVLDVSDTSLSIAKNFVQGENVKFVHADIFAIPDSEQADLIVMGEVLEHVENPRALLIKLKSILHANGRLFITTPTNAPAIDHIYLFRNTQEIRELIDETGLVIDSEKAFSSEDCSVEFADGNGISVLYSAFLRKE